MVREPDGTLRGENTDGPGFLRTLRDDEGFDPAEAVVLEPEDDEDVGGGEDDAPDQREAEEQVERDRGADDFGEVAGGDRDLAEEPEDDRDRAREVHQRVVEIERVTPDAVRADLDLVRADELGFQSGVALGGDGLVVAVSEVF